MRFKTKLSLVAVALSVLPSLSAAAMLLVSATIAIRELEYSILDLEIAGLASRVEAETLKLERLGLSESPFYARSARNAAAEYAAGRAGPAAAFLIIDAAGKTVVSPLEPAGSTSEAESSWDGSRPDSRLVSFPSSGRSYFGIERAFPAWGWRAFAILPEDAPALAAARVIGPGLFVLALGALLSALASRALAASLSRPVEALAEATRRMRDGDLGYRTGLRRDDELGDLSRSFDEMASRIAGFAADLGRQVELRTAELREAQARIVGAEKMSVLGRMAAGIAHELNSPLGAIRSSVAGLADSFGSDFEKGVLFAASLAPDARELFLRLSQAASPALATTASPRTARRAARAALAAAMPASAPAATDEEISDVAELGIAERLGEFEPLFEDPRRAEILSHALSLASARRLADIAGSAAEQASRVVDALRSYLRREAGHAPVPVDLGASVEKALLLLRSRIKGGVTLELDLEGGLVVLASEEKLVQVWTNLAMNALQAMDYKGRLTLRSRAEGGAGVVTVGDTGPGIPDEIKGRIFEPFFTTKRPEEGMGLGLDICRTIVEGFSGKIAFESRPGETTFTVRLPLSAAGPAPGPAPSP